jgi:hypothetical protein
MLSVSLASAQVAARLSLQELRRKDMAEYAAELGKLAAEAVALFRKAAGGSAKDKRYLRALARSGASKYPSLRQTRRTTSVW